MAKAKKSGGKSKSSVKVKDMRAKKSPKGGAVDMFLKLDGIKLQSTTTTVDPLTVSSLNFKK